MNGRRGFTLVEMMIVCTIAGIVAAAVGLFLLEVRIDGAKTESEVLLSRRASLAVDWMRRDLHNGTGAEWSVTDRGLVRHEGERGLVVAPRATKLEKTAVEGGHRILLVLERPLIRGRKVRVERSAFVGSR